MNKPANRKGLNTRLYKYADGSLFMNIPYANITAIDGSADRTYATGGQSQADMVGFDDPFSGTFKITTQIVPIELIALAATSSGSVTSGADMAVREEITCSESGTISLTKTPVAGSIYVYALALDLSGTPVATSATNNAVTISGATVGDKYVAYYMTTESTAKTITFNDNVTPGYYIIYSDTSWKDTTNTVIAEQIHCYKAKPKKAISLSYQGTGDPLSFEMTFDIMSDDNGNSIQFTRM